MRRLGRAGPGQRGGRKPTLRLLLINPNSSHGITERMAECAAGVLNPGNKLTALTVAGSPAYLSSQEDMDAAAPGVVALYQQQAGSFDAVVLACFGDPGLEPLRQVTGLPTLGLIDASMAMALMCGKRPGIVTGGSGWLDLLPRILARCGWPGDVPIACLEQTGGEIFRNRLDPGDAIVESTARLVRDRKVETVILGGAGLVGLAASLTPRVPVPLIDCTLAAVRLAQAMPVR